MDATKTDHTKHQQLTFVVFDPAWYIAWRQFLAGELRAVFFVCTSHVSAIAEVSE
jgi:hypothetical protein